ncbi:5-(carboxyamino)imidazole ribonucleotide mutase [Sedimentibacter sp. zth1]|uniref:5-(carboxyamino)imidazole ribonucleotide mutase n=1 Tax=Sedimentibacter sp. zth1 TaxID=2816908 RepID=UPI001A938FA0|nr:5-(carboxyamino)imidazole ribonucleotide mutase [Sedimentibacter sp. zth1]QSX04978.1 5-(carboxyamino)imidazole ribonucleotide mutase [Sedimentibacter sp. zth1]
MKVAIVMGSDSDFPVIEKGIEILKRFNVDYEVRVISAHRTPDIAVDFAKKAAKNGFEVIIAVAGKAAHLGGVIAGCSCLPVIGVPVKASALEGMDALLSIVQMPPGVPVATVAINAGDNAAILAIQILSVKYEELRKQFYIYKEEMAQKVITADKNLQEKLK